MNVNSNIKVQIIDVKKRRATLIKNLVNHQNLVKLSQSDSKDLDKISEKIVLAQNARSTQLDLANNNELSITPEDNNGNRKITEKEAIKAEGKALKARKNIHKYTKQRNKLEGKLTNQKVRENIKLLTTPDQGQKTDSIIASQVLKVVNHSIANNTTSDEDLLNKCATKVTNELIRNPKSFDYFITVLHKVSNNELISNASTESSALNKFAEEVLERVNNLAKRKNPNSDIEIKDFKAIYNNKNDTDLIQEAIKALKYSRDEQQRSTISNLWKEATESIKNSIKQHQQNREDIQRIANGTSGVDTGSNDSIDYFYTPPGSTETLPQARLEMETESILTSNTEALDEAVSLIQGSDAGMQSKLESPTNIPSSVLPSQSSEEAQPQATSSSQDDSIVVVDNNAPIANSLPEKTTLQEPLAASPDEVPLPTDNHKLETPAKESRSIFARIGQSISKIFNRFISGFLKKIREIGQKNSSNNTETPIVTPTNIGTVD